MRQSGLFSLPLNSKGYSKVEESCSSRLPSPDIRSVGSCPLCLPWLLLICSGLVWSASEPAQHKEGNFMRCERHVKLLNWIWNTIFDFKENKAKTTTLRKVFILSMCCEPLLIFVILVCMKRRAGGRRGRALRHCPAVSLALDHSKSRH